MIGVLVGKIFKVKSDAVIIMTQGVGYISYVCPAVLSQLQEGDEILLYIHTHVREDLLQLYGFKTEAEITLFENLLSVSGIGPKGALQIVDRGPDLIYQAIENADVDFFTRIPRIGKKNAQKIIIELKSKLTAGRNLDLKGEDLQNQQDIITALMHMGFRQYEILKALKSLPDDELTVEEKIKTVIKHLGSKVL